MPLSIATGLETKPNWTTMRKLKTLPFHKLTYIGIRDIDTFEGEVIKEKKIRTLSVDAILNQMRNLDGPIHISFDVDALDPSYVSSTGTPVENGLDPAEV
jgi:arginase